MKIWIIISRIIIGVVFIFSGTVKVIDPLGSAYKFHDYFMAFNIGFLDILSLPLAIVLCSAEFFAGFAVLTGIRYREGISMAMFLMVIFTPLTLVLALTNPVSDCGCFGDAIHLTNWQTFEKNVFIIIFTLFLFIQRRKVRQILRILPEWIISFSLILIFILFSLANLRFLPVIDFLPYKTGVRIADEMIIPEGAPADIYETTFLYEKDGITKEFTIDNYPANDTSWKFVDQKSVLIEKGYEPAIHDFSITLVNGEDITERILSNPGYTLLMISRKLTETNPEHLDQGFDLGFYCLANNIDFYLLTSSGNSVINDYDNGLPFCSVDEITLKTMVRSDPGYMLLKEGIIKEKWSWATIPDNEWFGKQSTSLESIE